MTNAECKELKSLLMRYRQEHMISDKTDKAIKQIRKSIIGVYSGRVRRNREEWK